MKSLTFKDEKEKTKYMKTHENEIFQEIMKEEALLNNEKATPFDVDNQFTFATIKQCKLLAQCDYHINKLEFISNHNDEQSQHLGWKIHWNSFGGQYDAKIPSSKTCFKLSLTLSSGWIIEEENIHGIPNVDKLLLFVQKCLLKHCNTKQKQYKPNWIQFSFNIRNEFLQLKQIIENKYQIPCYLQSCQQALEHSNDNDCDPDGFDYHYQKYKHWRKSKHFESAIKLEHQYGKSFQLPYKTKN